MYTSHFAHCSHKMVYCGKWDWCIVGFLHKTCSKCDIHFSVVILVLLLWFTKLYCKRNIGFTNFSGVVYGDPSTGSCRANSLKDTWGQSLKSGKSSYFTGQYTVRVIIFIPTRPTNHHQPPPTAFTGLRPQYSRIVRSIPWWLMPGIVAS